MQYAIGVDLGATKIEIGIIDQIGNILQSVRLSTLVKEGPQIIESQIIEGIRALILQTRLPVQTVGIGVAGQIRSEGIVQFSPNLRWSNYPLGLNLKKKLQLPIFLVNDVRAITWAEWLFGAGKNCENFICLFIGTGIGSGIVIDNQLLNGCARTCGEVGHMTIDFQGPFCTCGNRGCLEFFAGGWGIAAQAKKEIELDPFNPLNRKLFYLAKQQIDNVTAHLVIDAYHEGDQLAQLIINKALNALIAGCTSLINAFNPCKLILGGGIINGLPEWILAVEKGIYQWALKTATQSFKVVPAELGKQGGVIGSATMALNYLNS